MYIEVEIRVPVTESRRVHFDDETLSTSVSYGEFRDEYVIFPLTSILHIHQNKITLHNDEKFVMTALGRAECASQLRAMRK